MSYRPLCASVFVGFLAVFSSLLPFPAARAVEPTPEEMAAAKRFFAARFEAPQAAASQKRA